MKVKAALIFDQGLSKDTVYKHFSEYQSIWKQDIRYQLSYLVASTWSQIPGYQLF